MSRRHHAIVAFCCLSTIGVLSAGCAEDEKATPQVIFDEAKLSRSAGTDCRDSGPLFTIGEFGTPALAEASKPVKDGDAAGQGTVSVSCSVTSAGADEFNVDATVALSGATGGLFHVDGKFKAGGVQENIHAIFTSRESANTYEQRGCTVRYGTAFQGVAKGRVWGEIDCPKALLSGTENSCAATASFRFENCSQ